MGIKVSDSNENMSILFTGPLTINEISDFRNEMLTTALKEKNILLDLENVTECDAAGIQFLLSVMKTQSENKRTADVKIPEMLKETFSRSGLLIYFE